MKTSFSTRLIGGLAIGAVLATGLVMGLVWMFSKSSMGASMPANGWMALLAGTVISFVVSGALTATLVLGRRNGFDEGAHEIVWDTRNPDEK